MNAKAVFACLTGGLLFLQLYGCGGTEESQKTNVLPRKKIKVKSEKSAQNSDQLQRAGSSSDKVKYIYDPSDRRDPFEVLVMIKKPVLDQDGPLTPLQKYDLGQFRLIDRFRQTIKHTPFVNFPALFD